MVVLLSGKEREKERQKDPVELTDGWVLCEDELTIAQTTHRVRVSSQIRKTCTTYVPSSSSSIISTAVVVDDVRGNLFPVVIMVVNGPSNATTTSRLNSKPRRLL